MQLLESLGIETVWIFRGILIILAFLGLAHGVKFVISALSKKVKFKKGSLKVPGLGDLDFEGKETDASLDARLSQVNMKMILAVVSKTVEITTKVVTIKIHDTISQQMRFTEEKILAVRRELLRAYMKAMMSCCDEKDALSSHSDYQLYSALSSVFMYETLQMLKESFLRNGFQGMGDVEYREFLLDKFRIIEARGSEFFDLMYTGDRIISRSKLVEVHKGQFPMMKEALREVYDNARAVERRGKEAIDGLDCQLDSFLQKYLGATVDEVSSVTVKG